MKTETDYFDSDQQSINSELIEIVPWQHEWSKKFHLERKTILAALSHPQSPAENPSESRPQSSPPDVTSSQSSVSVSASSTTTTSSKLPTTRTAPESMNTSAGDASTPADNHTASSVHIEHIGSTSVEGLAAKPILDLMIGVENWGDNPLLESALEALGYVNAHPPQQLIPNTHFLFRRNGQLNRTHHLHVVEYQSEFWTTRLLYRDFLRRNQSIAMLYATLKTVGAEQHRYDRIAYNDFKAPFIRACIRAASSTSERPDTRPPSEPAS